LSNVDCFNTVIIIVKYCPEYQT